MFFGIKSKNVESKFDTSLFVQKANSRTKFNEISVEEDINWKTQLEIEKISRLNSPQEAASKTFAENKFNRQPIIKTTHMLISLMKISTGSFC